MEKIIYLFIGILSFTSCKECMKSTGKTITEQRNVAVFDKLVIHDNINVYLDNSEETEQIKIEAGENLMKFIHLDISEEGVLVISNQNTCNWLRDYDHQINVYLSGKKLHWLELQGFGNIQTREKLDVDRLRLECLNTGDVFLEMDVNDFSMFTNSASLIRLSGEAEKANLHSNGLAKIEAKEFIVQNCGVLQENINEISVYPVKSLIARITNKGTISYYNEPEELMTEISNGGKVVKK